ncbi:WD40-repeat-containing domain protein, partial [Mycena rebaudengoi]
TITMFFTTKNATKLNQYAPYGTLSAHVGAVHCIAVTEDGKLAASGGTDGVHIWDLEQRSVLQRPNGSGHRGATSAILWVRREDEPGEILFFGTQAGYLVCWRQKRSTMGFEEVSAQQLADAAEITGLAFNTSSSRIAVCHRKSTVQSYVIDSSLTPRPLFSVSIRNLVPKAVAFGEFKGSERDVLVFGYHSGEVITLQGGTGEVLKTHKVGSMIGDAGVNQRKGVFCIDDPFQGAALYRLDECRRVKTFGITMTKTFGRPRQVCFADDCTAIVSGSDHGIIYVFDRRTGEVIDRLRVDDQDWAQTV